MSKLWANTQPSSLGAVILHLCCLFHPRVLYRQLIMLQKRKKLRQRVSTAFAQYSYPSATSINWDFHKAGRFGKKKKKAAQKTLGSFNNRSALQIGSPDAITTLRSHHQVWKMPFTKKQKLPSTFQFWFVQWRSTVLKPTRFSQHLHSEWEPFQTTWTDLSWKNQSDGWSRDIQTLRWGSKNKSEHITKIILQNIIPNQCRKWKKKTSRSKQAWDSIPAQWSMCNSEA